ncbi:hypothetical protein QCA50_002275 [Cerrena zonata]|uniref:Uncharacterized protein n=1 Tax=Cerrena zonata TaxID=2478898 RepID=A0AAW0GPG2_9APHY
MPPKPSDIFVSGRPDLSAYQSLTPRTPHSRSGRAEEGLTEVELDEIQEDERRDYLSYRQQQAEPLLASSTDSAFGSSGYRSRGDDPSKKDVWIQNLPAVKDVLKNFPLLLGCLVAVLLFGLVLLSFKRPETLDEYVGISKTKPAEQDAVVPASPIPSVVTTTPPPELLISYENYTKFPLMSTEYLHECDKLMSGFVHHGGTYWGASSHEVKDVVHHDQLPNYNIPEHGPVRTCTKTITYQLDGHVGLLADLSLMAQVAGMAREQNRTFFIDDTYWNRGKWMDHFQDIRARQPGPEDGCRPPPPEELVACPRQARHWVINSRTAKFHLGHPFLEEYQDPYAHEINRMKPIFERAVGSFRTTIRPNAHNAALIRAAREEIVSTLSLPKHERPSDPDPKDADPETIVTRHHPDPYVAIHVRRGDKKASSFPHRGSYVPLEDYAAATHETWSRLFNNDSISPKADHFPSAPIAYIASDSHAAVDELKSAFPTSAAVFSLHTSTNSELRALASQKEYVQKEFNEETEEERIRLTRGMIVDFALLSGFWAWEGEIVPGATICTLSSTICKSAAVGLGFDRAFGFGDGGDHYMGDIDDKHKRWVELDNKGSVSPEWEAFDLF